MGVDCSCISVMCKAVAGAQWSEVQADARIVADTADAILVPVLGEILVVVAGWLVLAKVCLLLFVAVESQPSCLTLTRGTRMASKTMAK